MSITRASQTLDIIIEVVRITGLPETCPKYQSSRFQAATYTVDIAVDKKKLLAYDYAVKPKVTKKPPGDDGKEPESDLEKKFGCKVSKTSCMNIEIECKHTRFHEPHDIAVLEIDDALNTLQLNSDTELKLYYEIKSQRKSITVTLKVLRVSTSSELVQFKLQTRTGPLYTVADLEGLGIVSKILKSDVGLSSPEWVNLLGSLGSFVNVVEDIAELDIKGKIAISAVTAAFELFMKQKERDERVLALVQLMSTLYQMILDSDPLEKCRTLGDAVNGLISLTRECAYFVAQYIKTVSFAQRIVTNSFSSTDDMLGQFEKQFFTLKEVFFTGVMLSIGKMNARILEKLDALDDIQDSLQYLVENMALPVLGISWNKSDGCLTGTQEPLLSKIYKWGNNCNDEIPNIFLLHGPSKSGKTAVSHSVADYFSQQDRLGATIFLDASHSDSGQLFFPALTRELSKYDPVVYEKVMTGLRKHNKFLNDRPLRQYDFLNDHVFSNLHMAGPTLVIIDGLDKCSDHHALLEPLKRLPQNIRILITCQPTEDITASLTDDTCVSHKMTVDDDGLYEDLEIFISGYLSKLAQSRPNLFEKYSEEQIARGFYVRSYGIFMLAKAALQWIATVDEGVALKFIHLILASPKPLEAKDAVKHMKKAFLSMLTMDDSSIKLCLLGNHPDGLEDTVNQLIDLRYIKLDDGHIDVGCYAFAFGKDVLYFARISACTHTKCNAERAVPFLSALQEDTYSWLQEDSIYNALNCLVECKCKSSLVHGERSSVLTSLVSKHWEACLEHIQSGNVDILTAARFPSCRSMGSCNFARARKFILILRDINHTTKPQEDSIRSVVHCILACKCSYPPKAVQEWLSLVSLVQDGWKTCLSGMNLEKMESERLNSIVAHHDCAATYRDWAVANNQTIVLFTLPIYHTGLYSSGDKVATLLKFDIMVSFQELNPTKSKDVQLQAAILRGATEESRTWLQQQYVTVGMNIFTNMPTSETLSGAGVQMVEHPLSGKESWALQTATLDKKTRQFQVLWFNSPVVINDAVRQDDGFDSVSGEGQGIGYINSLLPGDRIVVTAKSESYSNLKVEVVVQLYEDSEAFTSCPLNRG
ncbi:hypothetical protein BDQ17DRAFT_1427362 [Cyathus striatus]|nr:hypothetical protein BDQ17DRAFT_1427362 [Cyathus striatus]